MRILVIGLGHVGIVTAAGLLRDGHVVIGVDTSDHVRDCVARGVSPIREAGVADLVAAGHAAGRLSVAASLSGFAEADLAFICVGTRGLADGVLDLFDLKAVARQLGDAIRSRPQTLPPMLFVVRSTIPPGSMDNEVIPAFAAGAGEPPGRLYEVASNPEFTREGSAVADYFAPARIVIGERCPGSTQVLHDVLRDIEAPIITTSFDVAALTKLADNAFHALKVAFANEIGRFALMSGISPGEVSDLFLADTKLNLSAAYLRPGGAFGGPCLKKDVRALASCMQKVGIAAPVIGHICESNLSHIDFLIATIASRALPRSRILLIGLSFKSGTDDVRESPFVALAESLLDRGYDLSIYDPDLVDHGDVAALAKLPSRLLATLLSQLSAEIAWDLVVVGKSARDVLPLVNANSPLFHIDRL
jgi:GDP-mannose 6-dehydrogenase